MTEDSAGRSDFSIDGLMGGEFPGFREQLENLKDNRLGRAINTISGFKSDTTPDYDLIGYILPVNPNRHIILTVDGLIAVIEPRRLDESSQIENYHNYFNPNDVDFLIVYETTGKKFVNRLIDEGGISSYNSRVVLRNDRPEDAQAILDDFSVALENARKLRDVREEAKQKTTAEIRRQLEDFFRPANTDDDGETPPNEPSE